MSRLFGVDLSRVPVVPASPAATGATKAVTKDGEVHFRAGAYQPGTPDGDWLIAHELAHVVQQRGGRGERAGTTKQLEREADRAATLAARGRASPIALRAQASAAYAFNEGEMHDTDLDEVADHQSDAHADDDGAKADARADDPATADHGATAHAGHDNTATHADADHDASDTGDDEVSAVLPAEDPAAGAATAGGDGVAAKPQKAAPSLGATKPEIGMGQLRGVRPDRIGLLFGQLHTAASADATKARAAQQANPPKQMSTGAAAAPATAKPKQAATPAAVDPKAAHDPKAAKDVPDHPVKAEVPGIEAAKQAKQAEAAAQHEAITQVVAAVKRSITAWFSAWSGHDDASADAKAPKMTEGETRQMAGAVDKLPTSVADVSTEPGPAPDLAMKREAKGSADKDRADLEKTAAALETLGRADSRAPMGEDHIDPTAPPQELTATPPAPGAGPDVALPTVAGAAASEEVGIVAQEQHGAEIDAALTKASADVTAERTKETQAERQARTAADAQIHDLKAKADADQGAARAAAQAEVQQARGQWQAEIDKKGADARKQGDKKVAEGMAQVEAEEAKANAEAKQHIDDGKHKADEEKQKGEKEAADEKAKGKSKSSGFWGWVSSKAKAAFDSIKQAVSSAIDACRRAVKAVIAVAKKLAMAVIELARKTIVGLIKAVGKALLAISDVLLAAFPALKAKFQNAIKKTVDKAVATVNRLADGLKQAVQKALDRLGAALDKALQLLEKGINAIIDAANAVVQGAIKAAQAVVAALGTWARLIKDVVTGPGAWIGKLGAAIVDGIKHHLWTAFKTAVVDWFKSKVFELLGIGGLILELLLEGGLTREHIIQMALDALMVAIPAALVAILIEKLVAMIVPAAGALMVIIEGLQAAWGTISRIIAAFAALMAFLLAVKSGGAGPLFATVLASAAIVVLDFVSTWVLRKLASAARKVGAKLKGLAAKFKSKRTAKKDAKAPKPHQHDDKSPKKHDDRDEQRSSADREKKDQKDKRNQEILAKAQRELPPKIRAVVGRGTRGIVLKGRLAIWRMQYRLTSLDIVGSGEKATIVAKVNPEVSLLDILRLHREELLMYVRDVAQQGRSRSQPQTDAALATHREEQTASGARVQKYDFEHTSDPPTIADAVSRVPLLRRGKAADIHVGEGKARLTGGWGNKQSSQRVGEFQDDKLQRAGGKYSDISARYAGRGAKLADAIDVYRHSGHAVSGFTKDELTFVIVLLYGVEPTRSPAAGVHSVQALDLMRSGTSIEDILGRDERGGLYPMSPKGAVAEARKADEHLDPNHPRTPGARVPVAADRHMEREIQLIHAWVNTLDLVFDDKATALEKIDEIKLQIRNRILGPAPS